MNYTYFVDTSLDNSQSQELDTSSQEEPSQEDAPAAEAEPVQYNTVFFAQCVFSVNPVITGSFLRMK